MGTISHFDDVSSDLSLDFSSRPNVTLQSCPSHDYNMQTISKISDAIDYNDRETLVDRIQLEQSPLKLSFVSYDRDSLDTGVVVQVVYVYPSDFEWLKLKRSINFFISYH